MSVGPLGSVASLSIPRELGEVLALARAERAAPIEAPAELLRLGSALPTSPSTWAPRAEPPTLEALDAIARIGAHLGRLERVERALPPDQAHALGETRAMLEQLVDCALGLALLRRAAGDALRTARPA